MCVSSCFQLCQSSYALSYKVTEMAFFLKDNFLQIFGSKVFREIKEIMCCTFSTRCLKVLTDGVKRCKPKTSSV